MKTLILTFVLTVFSLLLQGQPIETTPGGGARFHRNGQSMTLAQVEQAVQGNAEAAELISKARGGNVGAGVLGFFGGGLSTMPPVTNYRNRFLYLPVRPDNFVPHLKQKRSTTLATSFTTTRN